MRNKKRMTAMITALCVAAAPSASTLLTAHASSAAEADAASALADEAASAAADAGAGLLSEDDTEEEGVGAEDVQINYETVEIDDMEDFAEFVANCHVDTWSVDKYVVLNADLDFGGEEFEPIEVFSGLFDGQGHTLSGISITGYVDETGIFGTISAGAIVANLNVEGIIEPTGWQDSLGGVVGDNYGTVMNCTFSGDISADSEVGGIAAYNAESGIIIGCSTSGSILGNSGVGGIVGYNEGTISSCENGMEINTAYQDTTTSLDEISETLDTILQSGSLLNTGELSSDSDIGGIAGFSSGVITSCTNQATVGYEHVGYNVGGIVGRSSGFVSGCTNYGQVYGRKDVGGIAGQMQPYLNVSFTQETLAELEEELDVLGDLVQDLLDDVEGHSDTLSNHLTNINGLVDIAIDAVSEIADEAADTVDDASDQLNTAGDKIRTALNIFSAVGNSLGDYLDDLMDSAEDVSSSVSGYFSGISSSVEALLDELEEVLPLASDMLSSTGVSSLSREDLEAQLEELQSLLEESGGSEEESSDDADSGDEDAQDGSAGEDSSLSEDLQSLLEELQNAGGAGDSTDDGTADDGSADDGTTDDDVTNDGSADDGTTDNGTTNDGSTDGGTTDDGTTDDGTTDNGTTDDDVTDDGSADDGTTDDGTTDNGTADDGTTDDGTTDDGTTDNGTTDDGSTDGGTTDDGTTDDGATDDGTTDDGTTDDGTTDGGTTDDGTTDDGTTDDGTTDDGTTDDGTTDDGTMDDGTTDGGTTDDGTTDDGTTDDGSADDGTTDAVQSSVLPMSSSSSGDGAYFVQTAVVYSSGWRLVADSGSSDTEEDASSDEAEEDLSAGGETGEEDSTEAETDGEESGTDAGGDTSDADEQKSTGTADEGTSDDGNDAAAERMSDLLSSLEDYLENSESLQELQEELEDLTEDTGEYETPEIDTGELESLLEEMESGLTDMQDALTDVQGAVGDLSDSMDLSSLDSSVSSALDVLADSPDVMTSISTAMDVLASIDLQLNGVSGTMRANGDILYSALSQLMDEMENLNQDMSGSLSGTKEDLSAIANQFDRVMDVLVDSAERLLGIEEEEDEGDGEEDDEDDGDEDVVEDTSDEDIENTYQGRTTDCVNYGNVDADIDVGGIVGMVDVEYSLDPELDIDSSGSTTLDYVFQAKCIVDNCDNRGSITTRSNYAGGIAGRMEMGLVTSCVSYGTLECDGNYIGGVVGYSAGTVRSSTAKCDISGGRYVGGIAGYGTTLLDNLSMVNILEYEQYVGAIAGYAADIDEEEISGNYYYSVSLYGIDSVSYTGIAEGVSYAQLLEMDGIPETFLDLVLTFRTDDEVIGVITLEYGGSLEEEDLPEIPEKEGFYGVWSRTDYTSIVSDETITAEYIRYVTLLAADVRRESGLAAIQVDGNFRAEDELTLTSEETEDVELERWTLVIPDDGAETHQVRYLLPDGEDDSFVHVYLIDENGVKTELSTSSVSDYVTFEVAGNEVTFAVDNTLSENGQQKVWMIVGAAGAVVLLILIILIVKKRKKRTHGDEERAAAEQTA